MSRLLPKLALLGAAAAFGALAPAAAIAQAVADIPVVTLTDARRRAASVDPDAVFARGQVANAVWERRAARANLLTPELFAGGNYTHFSEPFFNFGTGTISPNATAATLSASYTLLGAGKFGDLRSAQGALESAEASARAMRFRTALETDAAYLAVLADRELSHVAADRLKRAEEQFGIARSRVRAGQAIATDSLQLLLEVNRARLALLRNDSALATSRLRLGRQIGLAGPAEAASLDTTVPPPLPFTVEEAAAETRARGPDVEAARAEERRADAVVLAQRERYLPEVILGATTGAYDAELFPTATRRTQVGVTVMFPIWQGAKRELAVARARTGQNIARAERLDSERGAAEIVARAWHGYATSRAAIELALVGAAVSAENFRVQRARYREGETTILDLLEAQGALTEASADLVRARYAARLALAQIEALLGRRIFETTLDHPTDR